MKATVTVAAILVAALAASVHAQEEEKIEIKDWPYCPCIKEPVAYHLEDQVTYKGNSTYCFTVKVNPPPGCNTYCCSKADLKKIEIDAKTECDIGGLKLKAWVNGQPSATTPTIERSAFGPDGTKVLKLTQLGLNLETADGAQICIQLNPNSAGNGCTNLEELCVPPTGSPAGVCQTSLFDSQNDCCGLNVIPPNNPPPAPKPCDVCAYLSIIPPSLDPYPLRFDADYCAALASQFSDDIATQAEKFGATLTKPFSLTSCAPTVVTVCGQFASDADGAKLTGVINQQLALWLATVIPPSNCPARLSGYTGVATAGAPGATNPQAPGATCLSGTAALSCKPSPPDFPKCQCVSKPFVTPFAVNPEVTTQPGFNESTRYCFTINVQPTVPTPGKKDCSTQDVLNKVEFWANDKTRRKIQNFYVKPSGASDFSVVAPSWGAYGDETLKCTGLNWSKAQADGGLVCMELRKGTSLGDFCLGNLGGSANCWLNLFNPDKTCCPLYESSYE